MARIGVALALVQSAAMPGEAAELPIFELPAVLLPGELMPLHIFEERYKRMIGECLDRSAPFGVVFRDSEGARNVGCEAVVTEVLRRFEDGRLDIVVTGVRPFRVLDRYEAESYPAGDVEPVAEPTEEAPDEAADMARDAFAELVEKVSGEAPDRDELATDDAYAIAGRVELPPETKQRLLEVRSEHERMRILRDALGALVGALEHSTEIAERAKMNGKVVVG